MPFSPASPVAGAVMVGFTSPTYTLTTDVAPSINGKQYAVTAIGGTQTGVDVNSVSKPFTVTLFRPAVLKPLPQANPVTGIVRAVPNNTYKLITRKGALPAANNNSITARITTIIEVPAGTDTYEPEDIKAMISCHFGVAWESSNDIGDVVVSGIL